MDKAKTIKTVLKLSALALAGVVTVLNDKVNKAELDETVAKKLAETMANQAKES